MQFLALENKMDYSKPSIIEKKWQNLWDSRKLFSVSKDKKKNFMYWKCSHIHLEIFTWDI